MSEKIDLDRWIPARELNIDDSGLVTEVLILSAKALDAGRQMLASMGDKTAKREQPFTCLVRVYQSVTEEQATTPVSVVGPVDILLGSLQDWGVLPKPEEQPEP